jgi:hypothetical protein
VTDHFCSSCGAPLEPGAHFCPNCAHPVGGAPAGEPAAPPGAPGAGVPPAGAGPSVPPAGTGGTPGQHKGRNLLLSAVAVVLVIGLAVGITLFLTRSSGVSGELFLESATSTGTNPFTDSTATSQTTTTAAPTSAPPTPTEGQTVVGTVDGSTAGLYGGTLHEASCDREKQITFLQANPDKAAAFASVLDISTNQIPDYLRGLTPVVLRHDTRVTNHGFVDGTATSLQSVLQAGTAVLVDKYGIPRVRCMCGNPLTPPAPIEGDVRYQGQTWPGFALNQTIVIQNDVNIDIDIFILVDTRTGDWFDRTRGDDGTLDKPHKGGDTTTGGGGTGGGTAICADTYDGAVNRLLGFRRNNDRAGASVCGSIVVLDYLWRLSDDFAGTLKIDHCEEGNKGQLPANIQGYACTMSNNAILFVKLVPQGPENWFVTYVALVDGRTSATSTPTATESECGSSGESFSPKTSDERLLVSYFRAINDEDYATAWNLLGDELQSGYGSQQVFADQMAKHVSCVRVLDIKPRSDQTYQLQFAAQYKTPFPAGSGQLQTFWTVSGGKIVGSGTGP